jgi:hypothetical protein
MGSVAATATVDTVVDTVVGTAADTAADTAVGTAVGTVAVVESGMATADITLDTDMALACIDLPW